MRQLIKVLTLSFLIASCGQSDTKQKELELKERELALKEKELALKERDSTNKTTSLPETNKNQDRIVNKSNTDTSNLLPIPSGFRLPNKNDIKKDNDWGKYFVAQTNLPEPYHLLGDFNCDGKIDQAYILFKGDVKRWGLFCFFKTTDGYIVNRILDAREETSLATNYSLMPWKKGAHVCVYDDDGVEIISKRKISCDAVGFSVSESHSSAFVFDKLKNKFTQYSLCSANK